MSFRSVIYPRRLEMNLPAGQSAFLWGARKTGKSTYLRLKFPDSPRYDLLKSELYLRWLKEPHLLREEILALPESALRGPVIIDEVQKIPALLDEIHWLIENTPSWFILCGSSARKLKKGAANLLGGRAWRYNFYPLIYAEINDFDLLQALQRGLIPSHYLSVEPERSIEAYIQDYLIQEIQQEGLVRHLPAFARFLDAVGLVHSEMINYLHISRECAIDAKAAKEYYQILVDTLLGYFIYPYRKRKKREIISSIPKFYLFDVGVANALAKRTIGALKGSEAGASFEHFILMELIAYKGLNHLNFEITYWRTKTGLEVDFVLGGGEVIVEVKISDRIDKTDLKGLMAFQQEHTVVNAFVVCLEPRARKIKHEWGEILILPWRAFLERLWSKSIL